MDSLRTIIVACVVGLLIVIVMELADISKGITFLTQYEHIKQQEHK